MTLKPYSAGVHELKPEIGCLVIDITNDRMHVFDIRVWGESRENEGPRDSQVLVAPVDRRQVMLSMDDDCDYISCRINSKANHYR